MCSEALDYYSAIDDKCHWLGIEYLNQHQGTFKSLILSKGFSATQLRNEVSGRFFTQQNEMLEKVKMIKKAEALLKKLDHTS